NQRSKKIELENKFRANNNFLENLIEQVPGGIYQLAIDSDGKISFPFLSKGISQTLGLELEEISNFTNISMAISRIHPDDLSRVIMSSMASAKKLEIWQCQFRIRTD